MSKPRLEQLRMNGIPEQTRAQTEWGVRVWKDWASERNVINGEVLYPLGLWKQQGNNSYVHTCVTL